MFTQRAALIGFVAFCFYLIAVVNNLPTYYYSLTWLAVGVLGASLGIAFLSLIGLDCRFEVVRSRSEASFDGSSGEQGPQISLVIANSGTLNKTGVQIEIRLVDSHNAIQHPRFLLEALPSGTSIETILPLSGLHRGHYKLQEVRLHGSDVLGIFRTQKRLTMDAETVKDIFVGPPILLLESGRVMGFANSLSGSRRASQLGVGEELRGTRPYAPGDDLRHIHWKSSARSMELVVKEFEQAGRETALVLWDGAAGTTWGNAEYDSTEWGLCLSASLCRTLLGSGTPCDLARLDAKPLLSEGRGLSSGQLPASFIESLASAEANRVVALESALLQVGGIVGRTYSSVLIISSSLSGELSQQVLFWRARGARVQIVLVNGAALGARSSDRRFKARGGKAPVQEAGGQDWPVTLESYVHQANRLRESGVEVITATPHSAISGEDFETPEAALYLALQQVFGARYLTKRPQMAAGGVNGGVNE